MAVNGALSFSCSHSHSRFFFALLVLFSFSAILPPLSVYGATDPSDVQGLQVIYNSLNGPSQLTGWTNSSGDPCGESWKGVTCEGSAVVSIQISGLGLNGTMGYLLSNFLSLRTLDMSDNNIHDTIPYQLPPNLTNLNLASNNLTGSFPYSISTMVSLNYFYNLEVLLPDAKTLGFRNVSHNSISQSIGDIFAKLAGLTILDLSVNNFTGDLPNSFTSLSNLSTLYLQNNQLTGPLSVLTGLPLTDLNVANNNFSGWIPSELRSIRKFIYDGNSFDNGPAPPPPPYTPPPPSRSRSNRTHSPPEARTPSSSDGQSSNSDNGNKGLAIGPIIGIVLGSLLVLVALIALVFCVRKAKKKGTGARPSVGSVPVVTEKGKHSFLESYLTFIWATLSTVIVVIQWDGTVNTETMQEQRTKFTATVTDLKPPPAENLMVERVQGKNGSGKRVKSPITATSYTVASLQTATNSFSQEFLIGEGSLGRVYRADFQMERVSTSGPYLQFT
ncbi:Protein STRUBBELIG-receptor family 8 [Vitis vinifera]|uniref:Protein STRUBBELIG-receptor family 8 n=1 Tax=Vitis vinifera TaxID=29760 RepID=A0A438EEC5_VITVI|nr:Protein STRUBBELIG-receptor family 8 [Vitis vinifera]